MRVSRLQQRLEQHGGQERVQGHKHHWHGLGARVQEQQQLGISISIG